MPDGNDKNDEGYSNFDFGLYDKKCERLLDIALEEYKQVSFDRYKVQQDMARNYIWIGVVLFSAEAAVFSQIGTTGLWLFAPTHVTPVVVTCAIVALFAAFLCICMGIHSMHTRLRTAMPLFGKRPVDFVGDVWSASNGDIDPTQTTRAILNLVEQATAWNLKAAATRGNQLRKMSRMALASAGMAMVALIAAYF